MLKHPALQRGSTLIQLMIGILVGFIVLMAVTQFMAAQLASNTNVLKATRLNQELRSVMDLVVRDLRRSAYWENAISGVWYEGSTGVVANPLQSITVGTTADPAVQTTANSITYSYDVNGDGSLTAATDTFTIQLNNNAVELVQAGTATQLSDPASTTITTLSFDYAPIHDATVTCTLPGSTPTLTVREIRITLTGQLASDSTVTRTLQDTVRMRGDRITGTCPPVVT